MNAQGIRVAIASKLGWTNLHFHIDEESALTLLRGTAPNGSNHCDAPNYPASLDAMALAEATLDGKVHPTAITDERRKFRDCLAKIMGVGWYQSAHLLRATAHQRAEAFCVALKLTVKEL